MTLLDKLLTNGSTLSEFDGTTPTSQSGQQINLDCTAHIP